MFQRFNIFNIEKERVKKRKVSFDDGQLSKVAQPHPPVKPHEEAKITTKFVISVVCRAKILYLCFCI